MLNVPPRARLRFFRRNLYHALTHIIHVQLRKVGYMNALDTNALVRFLVRDDEQQATMVKQLLLKAEKGNEQLFVPLIVTLETMWVLSSAYDFSRNEILDAFEGLLALNVLLLEGYASIVTLCSKARTNNLDLADLLIGIIARENGCATTLTFDKRAAGSEYFTLIGGR